MGVSRASGVGVAVAVADSVVVGVSRAATLWAIGAEEKWTIGMVPVGWAGRVEGGISEWEPGFVLSGLTVVGRVWSLGSGVLPAALEAVALTVHFQDVYVVGEPVQQCSGEPFRAKYLGPLVEGQIGRYQGGAPLVALAEYLEEQFRLQFGTRARSPVPR